jgi:uncharacterized protein
MGASIPAGDFGEWLEVMRAVLRGERDADVPCGGCVGCCVSSYPIPLRPTDRVALEEVPPGHLRLPSEEGALARMGYRADGSCPMLRQGACSIYRDRPQTCRDYDCRIYTAAGLFPDGERPIIRQRVSDWQFEFASRQASACSQALRQAVEFIRCHSAEFPVPMRATSATAAAVLAVKTYELFLAANDAAVGEPSRQPTVQHVVEAARSFDAGG